MVILLLLPVFILGAVTVVAMEALGLWILIQRLNRKAEREEIKARDAASVASPSDLNPSLHDKQGYLWILEPEKVKLGLEEKVGTEQRKKKDILEVTPVRHYGRVKDHNLILTESDGSGVEICLRGCTVLAVSATSFSSRKWAKKYPIKVESKDKAIYKGHKVFYIYLETSWEKESWCRALRLAAYTEEEKILSFAKLKLDFRNYLASLNTGYPSFMKPPGVFSAEVMDKSLKYDNSSSKVRQFLKKLGKKASKSGQEYKAGGMSIAGYEERKLSETSRSFQDSALVNGSAKVVPGKPVNVSFDDASVSSSVSSFTEPGSRSHISGTSDADSEPKTFDEGALCLNLLIARLFFDAKNNQQIMRSIQNRIQRALSSMRIPSYIGEVACTAVNPGTLPPRILAMRVLPSDMNEVWALEIDVEYLGGIVLDIETRLEIQELDLEGAEARIDTNTVDDVTSDLLEGFESLGQQLRLPNETIDRKEEVEGDHSPDESEISKSAAGASSQVPKWKSVLHSIAKQVSQVPLALGIRISSLRGTLRLCIKPPPSDQMWFGFTSMPDIEFDLESFVGDHKVTSGRIALFLINRIKAGIRETLVLPNRESISVPWMIAEKDDWIPRKVAPFMWYKSNQDSSSGNTSKRVMPCCQPGEAQQTNEASHTTSETNLEKSKDTNLFLPGACQSLDPCPPSLSSVDESTSRNSSFQELKTPLLMKDTAKTPPKTNSFQQESGSSIEEFKPDINITSRSLIMAEGQIQNGEEDDARYRRMGTRERMRGLSKKVGEKLEVKRRHFEEKGRSFVERIRGRENEP